MPSANSRYAVVRINTLWLTDTALTGGTTCRTRVEGLHKLQSLYATTHTLSADTTTAAKVWTQRGAPSVIGKEISILIDFFSETNATALLSAIEAQILAATDATIEIIDFITLTVTARPVYRDGAFFTWEKRSGAVLQTARFNFICTSKVS